ncbi:carboxypeptidase-like regulatory domain-containing protein [Halobacillus salinus]|uniref:carboxypeptidase-like regulatory domain-containing protein n=1 Tax=Halobacillus salinus TaxID=192814 RepID=UPI0009A5DB5F|nr:carboxypeptidase-like regulatory domain-containing protein [Halobacillus salinus]
MRIKLKVKHVFGLLIAFAAVLFVFVNWIYPPVQSGAKSPYEAIERLKSDHIFVKGRMSYIEEKIIMPQGIQRFDVFKSTTGAASADFLGEGEIPLEVRAPFLKEYLEDGYKQGAYTEALQQYSMSFFKKGDLQQAIDVVEKYLAKYPGKNEAYWEAYFLKVELSSIKDIDKALQLVESISSAERAVLPEPLKSEALEVEVRHLISQKKYDEAYQMVESYLTPDGWGHSGEYLEQTRRNLKRWTEGETELHTISGTISTDDGDPVANSIVYAKPEADINTFRGEEHELLPHAYTDEDGNYTMYGVPEGEYAFFFGTQFEQVKGYAWPEIDRIYKVDQDLTWNAELRTLIQTYQPTNFEVVKGDEMTFDWEGVDGAAYYQVLLEKHVDSGSTTSAFQSTDQDELTVSLEELYDFLGGVSLYDEDEHGGRPIPESLLSLAYPDAERSWSVIAFDKNGEFLSSSQGFRLSTEQEDGVPFFSVEERELTEADQALLDHEYERAASLYKEKGDAHSLRMFIRLKEHEKNSGDLLPLKREYAEVSGVPGAWRDLASDASRERKWEIYFEAMDHVLQQDSFLDDSVRATYATALAKNGRYEEAENWFKKASELGSDEAIRTWTALKVYQEGIDEALAIADQYPSYHGPFDEMAFGDWESLLEALKQETVDEGASEQLKQGLEVFFSPDQDIEPWVEKNNLSDVLESFFKEIQ